MKNSSLQLVGGLLGVIGLVLAARFFLQQSTRPLAYHSSTALQSLVDSNTAFALDLYREVKGKPGNLFFSPYSISTCLAMTFAGARGETEKEMAAALHFNLPQSDLHLAFARLTDRMQSVQRGDRITLTIANSLWIQHGYKFSDAYVDLIQRNYHAEARSVNFSIPDAAREINLWVKQKTDGKIERIVAPSALNQETALVLCNAIYFKGKWVTEFDPKKTISAPFYPTAERTDTVTVQMMRLKSKFKMIDTDDGTQLIDLPYSGQDLSMTILLPPGQSGMDEFEQRLTTQQLRAWLMRLDGERPEETGVVLPRFKTTYTFNLVNPLRSLGMTLLFDSHKANFSGMDPTDNLFVSDAVHKAFVEVNETGTEAAAATHVRMAVKGVIRSFIADRPFIFLIREHGSGSILFLGRLVRPESA